MVLNQRLLILVGVILLVGAVLVVKANRDSTPASVEGGVANDEPEASAAVTASLPRLVDLGSNKCIPCKMMAPILEELKREYAGTLIVEVIDVREDRQAGTDYGIRVIPTQVFFDDSGKERYRHEGYMSKEAILATWQDLGVDLEKSGEGR